MNECSTRDRPEVDDLIDSRNVAIAVSGWTRGGPGSGSPLGGNGG